MMSNRPASVRVAAGSTEAGRARERETHRVVATALTSSAESWEKVDGRQKGRGPGALHGVAVAAEDLSPHSMAATEAA